LIGGKANLRCIRQTCETILQTCKLPRQIRRAFLRLKNHQANLQSDKAREQRHVSAGKITKQTCKMTGITPKAPKDASFPVFPAAMGKTNPLDRCADDRVQVRAGGSG
jgi:hypothetical protein